MKNLFQFGCGIFLLGHVLVASAQPVWSYLITDGGNGNSLVTWTVTGTVVAEQPFTPIRGPGPSIIVSIDAPQIYADSYSSGGIHTIPIPDGSYFNFGDVYSGIYSYQTINATGNGNDNFSLLTPRVVAPNLSWNYNPGSQSVLIPVDFSNFNPGTYQSVASGFATPLTVNLTVQAVPEPSAMVLAVCVLISALLAKPARRVIER